MVEHRTTDTDELAPHPGMTGNDLAEFERWVDTVTMDTTGLWVIVAAVAVFVFLGWPS